MFSAHRNHGRGTAGTPESAPKLAKKRNWVRADIILRVAEGQTNYMIAKQLGLSRNTVQHWRYRLRTRALERIADSASYPVAQRR